MAVNICPHCEQAYGEAGCTTQYVRGLPVKPYGGESYWDADGADQISPTCHDCGAEQGEHHHHNWDMAECPVCGGQLVACEHGRR
jgi:hypothetical protein